MKKYLIAYIFCTLHFVMYAQKSYNGLPMLKIETPETDCKIGNELFEGAFEFSVGMSSDTLPLLIHSSCENFVFFAENDSISFQVYPDGVYNFYVQYNNYEPVLVVIKGEMAPKNKLVFDTKHHDNKLKFLYGANENNAYLNALRAGYPIDSLVQGAETDMEKALRILHWVHNRWEHNGDNEPLRDDAVSILEEAGTGKGFRCVEYSIVLSACLNAAGFPARPLWLKTKDVETTPYGAGHVVAEVYLHDLKKWVFVDGQMDVMPLLNGMPLNAVELQQAITGQYDGLEIKSFSGMPKYMYAQWIYPYLYYFDVKFDNRDGIQNDKLLTTAGKRGLMLVPQGAKKPAVFQNSYAIDYVKYTNSIQDFYSKP